MHTCFFSRQLITEGYAMDTTILLKNTQEIWLMWWYAIPQN